MSQRIRGKRGTGSVEKRGDKWTIRRSETNPVTGDRRRWREFYDTKADAVRAQSLPATGTADASSPAHERVVEWSLQQSNRLRLNGQIPTAAATERNARALAPWLGRVRLGNIDKEFLDDLWLKMLTAPRSADDERPYSRKYVADLRTTLKQALDDAEGKGIIPSNPSRLSPLPKKRVGGGRDKVAIYTPEEFGRYIDSLWEELRSPAAIDWILAALIASFTGCRRGEALGLRWCDVGADSVTFEQQVNKVEGEVFLGPLKTPKAYRQIRIGPKLIDAITAERERRSASPTSTELINPRELPDPDAFSSWIKRSQERADVPILNLHALRHTVASILIIRTKVTPLEVAAHLGHENASFTQNQYGHLWPQQLSETGALLADIRRFGSGREFGLIG